MKSLILLFVLILSNGCGYQFQARSNPYKGMNIEKVYIRHFVNNSLIPGVDAIFTGALIKEFSKGRRLKLVSDSEKADAYVLGVINTVTSSINSSVQVPNIAQDDPRADTDIMKDTIIATEYVAFADLKVSLIRTDNKQVLWTQAFTQRKLYPANNRFGELGVTSMLINRSQEQMAVQEMASNLANDIYENMLEGF